MTLTEKKGRRSVKTSKQDANLENRHMAEEDMALTSRLAMFEEAHEALEEMLAAGTQPERANRICARLGKLVGAQQTSLFVRDPCRAIWRCLGGVGKRASGYADGVIEGEDCVPLGGQPVDWRAARRSNMAVRSGTRRIELQDEFVMVVPIAAGSEVPGMLLCEYDAPHTIEDPLVAEGVRVFLAPLGGLLECYQERLRFQEQARSLELLHQIGSHLSSIRDEDKLLEAILSLIDRHLQVECCSIMIIDQDRKYLRIKKAFGMPDVDIGHIKVAVGEGIAGFVAAGTRPLLIRDVSAERHLISQVANKERFRTNSLLSVPLVSQGETIGVINVNNRKDGQPFSEDDKELLFTIGSEIAAVFQRSYMALQLKKSRDLDRDIKQSMV